MCHSLSCKTIQNSLKIRLPSDVNLRFGCLCILSKLNLQATVQKFNFDHNRLYRLISSDPTNVISHSVMKDAFHGIIKLTTDVYAREYRSGQVEDVGESQNIQ